MKTVTALEAKNRLGQVIDAAQRQPVTVTRQGRPSVVILSAEEYDRRQSRAWRKLLATMDATGAQAAKSGLTDAELDRLMADES
jgi:prevent-host-death family protein